MTNEKEPDEGGGKEEPGGVEGNVKPQNAAKKLKWQYSGEQLLDLRNSPSSKTRPNCLSSEFCDDKGVWEPELWHASFSGRRSRGPSPLTLYDGKEPLRKKYSDAKERILDEKDGIILSPQRRSFGHGCQIAFQPPGTGSDRSHTRSPVEGKDRDLPLRTIPPRRIGSGRILTRNRPTAESSERELYRDRDRDRDRDWDRDTRDGERSGRQGYDRNDRYHRRGGFGREGGHRRNRDDPPEWFTGGPTSQSDTIQLHGFNEHEDDSGSEPEVKGRRPSVADRNGSMETASSSSPEASQESSNNVSNTTPSKDFDFNEFFKLDHMLPQIPIPDEGDAVTGKSRFSHLFSSAPRSRSNSGGTSRSNSRHSSPHDPELEYYATGIDQLTGRSSPIMVMGDRLFTPIKPAEGGPVSSAAQLAILDMIQKNQQQPPPGPSGQPLAPQPHQRNKEEDYRKTVVKQKLIAGQAKSLAEIEADMKKVNFQHNSGAGDSPGHVSHTGGGTSGAKTLPGGSGGLPPQLMFAAQGHGSSPKGDQSAFNNFVASMKATGSLGRPNMAMLHGKERSISPKPAHPDMRLKTPSPPTVIPTSHQGVMDKAAIMMAMKTTDHLSVQQQQQQQQQGGRGMSPLPPGIAQMARQRAPPMEGPILNLPENRVPSPVNMEVMAALFKHQHPTSAQGIPHHPLGVPPGIPHPQPPQPPRGAGGPPANLEQAQALVRQNPELMAAVMRQYQVQMQQQQQQQLVRQRGASPVPPNQEAVLTILRHAVANPAFAAALMAQANKEAHMAASAPSQINRSASPRDMLAQALLQSMPRMHSPVATLGGHQSPLPTSPAALHSQPHSPLPGTMAPPTLGPAGLATSPLFGASSNSLVPPGASQTNPLPAQRIPSPQELAKHTQSILQQALIKRQLEVQKEKYLAKEAARAKSPAYSGAGKQQNQQQQKHAQQQQRSGQHQKNSTSTPPGTPGPRTPSKLATAFMPTSVIRKMHETKAEAKAANQAANKETDGGKGDVAQNTAAQNEVKAQYHPSSNEQNTSNAKEIVNRQSEGHRQQAQRGHNPPPSVLQRDGSLEGKEPHLPHHHPPPSQHHHGAPEQRDTEIHNNHHSGPMRAFRQENHPLQQQQQQHQQLYHHHGQTKHNHPRGMESGLMALRQEAQRAAERAMKPPTPPNVPHQQHPAFPMNRGMGPPQQQQARVPMNPAMMLPSAVQANLIRGMVMPGMVPPVRGVSPPQFPQVPLQNASRPMGAPSLQQMLMNHQHQGSFPQGNPAAMMGSMARNMQQGLTPPPQSLHHQPAMNQLQQEMFQQQQRDMRHQAQPPPQLQGKHHPNMPSHSQLHGQHQGHSQENRRSPINQLAKWFSPDLLKQPMAKLPPSIPSGQKIMSVEELERQQQQQVVG